jgi:hypothetical protein
MSQHVRSANVLVKRDREALAGTTRNALGRVVVPKVAGSSPLGHPTPEQDLEARLDASPSLDDLDDLKIVEVRWFRLGTTRPGSRFP